MMQFVTLKTKPLVQSPLSQHGFKQFSKGFGRGTPKDRRQQLVIGIFVI
jgi:hypothetical protein